MSLMTLMKTFLLRKHFGKKNHQDELEAVTRLLDNAFRIPGLNFRVGIVPILDLVPAVGPALGTLLSGYIVTEAYRRKLPVTAKARIFGNLGARFFMGLIPGLGPILMAMFKANVRNLNILEKYSTIPAVRRPVTIEAPPFKGS